MIDIHCHILHGVDDGAKDLAESVAMARIAYEDGIRDIIVTPHFNPNFLTNTDTMLRKMEELQRELDRQEVGVRLHPGNEVRYESREFWEEHKSKKRFSHLGRPGKFILLEQRWTDYDADTPGVVERLLDEGVTPVLAHPERHGFFRDNPEPLLELIEGGMWTQVSADSLVGNFGADAEKFGRWLIAQGYAHTIATDAHNVNRKPNLGEGLAVFADIAGAEELAKLKARLESMI